MRAVEALVAALWVAFGLIWIVAALRAKSDVVVSTQFIGARLVVAAAVVLLVRFNVLDARAAFRTPVPLEYAGVVLLVCGLALALWARAHLGRNWGMPMTEKVGAELVTSGPYARVRHPIYSGIILAMVGTACAAGIPWLAAAILLGAFFVYSARVEERTMSRRFPASYDAYRSRTRMLVPFLY